MNRLESITLSGVAALALLGGTARAQQGNPDQQFVQKAYSINQGEIELGRMAEQKGTSADVKAFGRRMVTDHTKALHDLETAAGQAGIAVPDTLLAPQEQLEGQLAGLSGKQFDDAYMKHMVAGHGAAIDAFTQEIANGTKAPLRTYAQKTLPVLESHEQKAVRDEQRMRQQGH